VLGAFAMTLFSGCNGNSLNSMGPPDMAEAPDLTPAVMPPDLGDNGMVSNMYPAPHPDAPQVANNGGPVLSAPVFVPVFFANDDATQKAALEDYVSKVGATNYWTAIGKEYGVGPATSTKPVELTETAPATIDDGAIQTWLAGKLNANDMAWPANTANTVYILHYPTGTTITLQGQGGAQSSCQSFGGYHSNTSLDAMHGSAKVAYAVIPRCSGFGAMGVVDTATAAESHEMIEASTDPYPQDNPAYGQVDDAHLYWMFALGGGEVGDMCAQDPAAFTKFDGLSYTVQRSWSNASAAAGHDPCVPLLTKEVYFNAAPELPDMISLGGLGGFQTTGVSVPVGMSKTIDLDLFSDGPTGGPWTVSVKDYQSLMGGASGNFTFALDRTQGQNGEKLHLTINSIKATQYNAGIFVVISKLNGQTHFWFGLIGQ
jgi:hypothetical protein